MAVGVPLSLLRRGFKWTQALFPSEGVGTAVAPLWRSQRSASVALRANSAPDPRWQPRLQTAAKQIRVSLAISPIFPPL